MRNINLGQLSRYLDRRLLIVTVALLGLAAVLNFVILGSTQGEISDVQAEYDAKQSEIVELEDRVNNIRQGGADDIAQLVERVGKAESAVPSEQDLLGLTAQVAQLAASTGTTLLMFDQQGEGNNDVKLNAEQLSKGILTATPYRFDVVGAPESVTAFLEAMVSSQAWVATIDSVSLTPKAADNRRITGEEAHIFGPSVGASGVVLLWGMADPPVVAKLSDEAGSAAADPAASQPSAPSAPQPAVSQPAAPQPAVSQPAAPAAPQPVVSQPAAPQPAVSQPAAPQPAVSQPAAPATP